MPSEKRAPPGRARASGDVGRSSWYETVYRPRAALGDLPAVLEALGHHVGRDGKLAKRDERTPSLHIYGDHAHDFGSGEHYKDPLELLEALEGISHEEARDRYAAAAGVDRFDGAKPGRNGHAVAAVRAPRPKRPATKAGALDTSWLSDLTDQAAAALERGESPEAQRARAYLDELGIPDAVTERLRLGVIDATVTLRGRPWATAGRERRLWMPYLGPDGRTIYGTARALFGEEPKTLVHRSDHVGPCPAPYNAAALERAKAAGYVLLLEGEKDTAAALAALGVDAPALGLRGGALPTDGTWPARIAAVGVPVVVCFDRDDAGAEKAAKMVQELTAAGCSDVRRITVPAPHKDAADVLAADGPDLLAETLETWHDAAPSRNPEEHHEHLGPPPRDPSDPLTRNGAKAAAAPRGLLLTAEELLAQDFPAVPFVVPGYVVRGLNILAGKPKMGKSFLALHLALAVARGGRFFNQDAERGHALYYGLEDGARRLQSRLRMMGVDPRELGGRLHLGTDLPRLDQGGYEELDGALRRYPGTSLVVLDTLARVKPSRQTNANAYDADALLGDMLQRVAKEHDVGVVVVTHLRKLDTDDPLDAISGSLGLPGTADAVMVLRRKRGEADAVLQVTSRDFEEHEDALSWDPQTGTWALVGAAAEYALSKQRRLILEAVREAGVPVGPKYVSDAVPELKPGSVRVLMQKMLRDGELASPTRGEYVPGSVVANVAFVANRRDHDD